MSQNFLATACLRFRACFILWVCLLAFSGQAQQIDILRPDGTRYKTIRRTNQVNLTYQQTPFLTVNYSAKVADITADTLFLVDKRMGLIGLAVDKITGLQRIHSGLNLAYSLGGAVLIGVAGGRLIRSAGLVRTNGSSSVAGLLLGGVAITSTTLLSRLITPRKPRKRLSRGWTFRALPRRPNAETP